MSAVMVPKYGSRLALGMSLALNLHDTQARKRGFDEPDAPEIPYAAHLLEVCALTMQIPQATEDHYIAAVLHDAVEDQPDGLEGVPTADIIEAAFPESPVLRYVIACTDSAADPGADRDASTWRERKEAHVAHLLSDDVAAQDLYVPLADKVANARAIVTDLQIHGPIVWKRFNASPDDIYWYYSSMLAAFERTLGADQPLVRVLSGLVAQIRWSTAG